MEGVGTALTAGFTAVGTELTKLIGDVIPVALPIVGAMIVVTVGIKVFKRITGR